MQQILKCTIYFSQQSVFVILFFLFGVSFQAYSQVTSPVLIPKNVLLISPNSDGTIKSLRDVVMHEPVNIVMTTYSINDYYPWNAVNREINVGNGVFVPYSDAALQNITYPTGGEKLIELKWKQENAIGVLFVLKSFLILRSKNLQSAM
jgi:hypothetical protein